MTLKANQFITPQYQCIKQNIYWNDNTQTICSSTSSTLMACQEACRKTQACQSFGVKSVVKIDL